MVVGSAGGAARRQPAAVTVIADDAMRADAWATALTVIGAELGLVVAQREGLAARFVLAGADGARRILATPRFDAWIAA